MKTTLCGSMKFSYYTNSIELCVSIGVVWELRNVFATQKNGKCSNRVGKEIGGSLCWTPATYYILSGAESSSR